MNKLDLNSNEMIDIKIKEWWKTKRVITENEDKLKVLEKEIRELEKTQRNITN